MQKKRLDGILVERGLVESRAQAQRLIMAGQVRVNGQLALKPAASVAETAQIDIDQGPPFVSRGGEKLAAALAAFQISPTDKVCADVGASTGGFTDCLLQNGARRVYAIDVGKGILHWKLRQDSRVVVMEETNARYVEYLPEEIQFATIDASFISLKVLLPVVKGWFGLQATDTDPPNQSTNPGGEIVALIKPQFEAGRAEAARGDGVIRDPEVHRQVLHGVLDFACQLGFHIEGLCRSPLLGPKGNVEFLTWLSISRPGFQPTSTDEVEDLIASVT
jgi:23S rRNA (cytidine1920-2'-O)/16S rRNA (cytidine1409-2'-O)-methyltransferase